MMDKCPVQWGVEIALDKEYYNFVVKLQLMSSWQKWPNADVPNFQSNVSSIYQYLMDLGARVLSIMAIGLKMVSCQLFRNTVL